LCCSAIRSPPAAASVWAVAKEMGLLLLDMHARFADAKRPLRDLVGDDGLHLSAAGAKRYAACVCDFILKSRLLA